MSEYFSITDIAVCEGNHYLFVNGEYDEMKRQNHRGPTSGCIIGMMRLRDMERLRSESIVTRLVMTFRKCSGSIVTVH